LLLLLGGKMNGHFNLIPFVGATKNLLRLRPFLAAAAGYWLLLLLLLLLLKWLFS